MNDYKEQEQKIVESLIQIKEEYIRVKDELAVSIRKDIIIAELKEILHNTTDIFNFKASLNAYIEELEKSLNIVKFSKNEKEEQISEEEILEEGKNIELSPVISSNIEGIGFNKDKRLLSVMFKGGSKYIYTNVEPEIYTEIINSPSIGKTLNSLVIRQKEKYKYYKI